MLIEIRLDGSQIFEVDAEVRTIKDPDGNEIPEVTKAVFKDPQLTHDQLDNACLIIFETLGRALPEYFNKYESDAAYIHDIPDDFTGTGTDLNDSYDD